MFNINVIQIMPSLIYYISHALLLCYSRIAIFKPFMSKNEHFRTFLSFFRQLQFFHPPQRPQEALSHTQPAAKWFFAYGGGAPRGPYFDDLTSSLYLPDVPANRFSQRSFQQVCGGHYVGELLSCESGFLRKLGVGASP